MLKIHTGRVAPSSVMMLMGQTSRREYLMWSPMDTAARRRPTYTAAMEGLTGVPKVAVSRKVAATASAATPKEATTPIMMGSNQPSGIFFI